MRWYCLLLLPGLPHTCLLSISPVLVLVLVLMGISISIITSITAMLASLLVSSVTTAPDSYSPTKIFARCSGSRAS